MKEVVEKFLASGCLIFSSWLIFSLWLQ